MRSSTSFVFILSIFSLSVLAANDWARPCTDGWCSFETADATAHSSFGTLVLNGPSSAISDLTLAAGWHILDCDPTSANPQSVRLVCESEDEKSAGCSHLFEGGAENTIVRLPDSCGAGPFARVVSSSLEANQTQSVVKRSRAIVRSLKFDYNFAAIPESNGPVEMHVAATNLPGQTHRLGARAFMEDVRSASEMKKRYPRASRAKRGWFTDVIDKIKDAAKTVGDDIKGAADEVKNDIKGAEADAQKDTTVSKNDEKTSNLAVTQSFPAITQSINCPVTDGIAVSGSISVTPSVDIQMQAVYGYVVSASIIPPKVTDFAIHSSLAGDANAVFKISSAITGRFDSGRVTLFSTGLPGFSIPGIFSIGPTASIQAQVITSLGVAGSFTVAASWKPDLQLMFPPEKGDSSGKAVTGSAPFEMSVDPASISETITAGIEAHLIPRLDFGLELLDGIDKATVFLDVDTSVTLQTSLTVPGDPTKITSVDQTKGCVDVYNNIAVQAGTDAELPPFFSKTTSVNLINLNVKLFEQCNTPTKRAPPRFGYTKRNNNSLPDSLVNRDNSPLSSLVCPGHASGSSFTLFSKQLSIA